MKDLVRWCSQLAVLGTALAVAGGMRAQEIASPIEEQKLTAEIDVRNRFVEGAGGSRETYRSIVNLGEGPRLFDGQLRFRNAGGKYADRLEASGYSWGGDPYNTARVEFGRQDVYKFRFDYRNATYFNALPSFANPLLAEGLLLSQRSLDINRRQADAELEVKPNSVISPFVAFSHASGFGNGITTFVTDGNEFPVATGLNDSLNTVRGGVRINLKRWNFTLEQGRMTFEDEQQVFFGAGRNRGNRRTSFLGRHVILDDLNQSYEAEGKGTFNRAVVQGRPWELLTFTGQFLYSQPSVDVRYNHAANGDFVLSRAVAAFTGQFEESLGDAQRPHSSGSWSTEIRPHRAVRIVQSWYTDRFHISAGSLTGQTFNTAPETSVELRTFDRLVMNYNQHQVDVIYDAYPRVSLRGGHRYVWGDARVRESTLNLFTGPGNRGELRRHVGLAGASFRVRRKWSATFDFEASPGDETFFRTGLMDYRKAKIRTRYRLHPSFTLAGSFFLLHNDNPAPDIDFELRSRQASLSLFWTPDQGRRFTVLADYTRATLETGIPILSLPFFRRQGARYRDRGHHGSVFAETQIGGVRLRLGGSLSITSGSRPTRFYQPQLRLTGPIRGKLSWVGEWRWFGFNEEFFSHENFRAQVFSAGFRFRL